ncbi:MAG: hypothetical protein QW700_05990 [Desulfurococcaceae archaeon]
MVFRAGKSIRIVTLLVKSILRRNAHLILLVSLSAPLVLTVILYSLPSPVLFLEEYFSSAFRDVNVVITSRNSIIGKCIKAGLVEGELAGYGPVTLVYPKVITKEFLEALKLNETGCMCSGLIISLPRDIYVYLNYTCNVGLRTLGACGSYCTGYTHKSLEAVIVLVNGTESFQRDNLYLCFTSKLEIARNTLVELESSILSTVDAWLFLLLIASLPGVYVASIRVLLSIKSELRVLLNVGLSEAAVTLYCTFALWILEVLSGLFLLSLSTTIVYSASTALSTLVPALVPTFRLGQILRHTLLIFAFTYLVSSIASRRFARNEELL